MTMQINIKSLRCLNYYLNIFVLVYARISLAIFECTLIFSIGSYEPVMCGYQYNHLNN